MYYKMIFLILIVSIIAIISICLLIHFIIKKSDKKGSGSTGDTGATGGSSGGSTGDTGATGGSTGATGDVGNKITSMFVAVGYNNIAYSTPDGTVWTGVKNADNIFDVGSAVACNGKLWVAVGILSPDSLKCPIATSVDGINWKGVINSRDIFPHGCYSVACNKNLWVVGGPISENSNIATSSDGFNWKQIDNTRILPRGIAWSPNYQLWFIVGDNSKIPGSKIPGSNVAFGSVDGNWWYPDEDILLEQGTAIANSSKYDFLIGIGKVGDKCAVTYNGATRGGWATTSFTDYFSEIGKGIAIDSNSNMVMVGNDKDLYSIIAFTSEGVFKKSDLFSAGNGIATNDKIWVAVGSPLDDATPKKYTIAISGSNWQWIGIENSSDLFTTPVGCVGVAWGEPYGS
jgi:hypothetical protein